MSAIGGYYSRSEAPVDRNVLNRLSSQMTHIGPDGESYELANKVGMLFRPFITHDEVREDPQPRRDEDGFMITFDGWLDNREELLPHFGAELSKETAVSKLVLAVYKRWGVQGFARLLGNFSLAIWDPHRQQLCLAADSLGFRSIYVHLDSNRVVWSSRARALIKACNLPLRINVEYVGAFLANTIPAGSPYTDIKSVPGGHAMIIERDRSRLESYWNFSPEKEIHYPRDEDYEEHFRDLFVRAVSCRMRGDGPLFSELSGGVDSSSIVCVIDRLRQEGHYPNKELHTISYVFDQAKGADERPYIAEIENVIGCRSHHLREEDFPILSKRAPSGFRPDLPANQVSYLARYDRVSEILEAGGSRVLLNGIGGDQAFLSEGQHLPILELADLWAQRRPFRFLERARCWSRVIQIPLWRSMWSGIRISRLRANWRLGSGEPQIGDWFQSSFIKKSKLTEQVLGPKDDLGFHLPSRAFQYTRFRDTMRLFALEKSVSHKHFEMRFPYLDRRLLEFALAIPFNQKVRASGTRSIVRRALKGWVPEQVLLRRTKMGPTEAFQRALIRERNWIIGLFRKPLLGELGVVDPVRFRSTLHKARHGLAMVPAQIHRTVSLELWLRSMGDDGLRPAA